MEKANLKAREYRFFSQKNQKMVCLHSEQALAYARYLELSRRYWTGVAESHPVEWKVEVVDYKKSL